MPEVTTKQVGSDEIGDTHNEYYKSRQNAYYADANSSGYLHDLDTTISIPSDVDEADLLIFFTGAIETTDDAGSYPYRNSGYIIELDGNNIGGTQSAPLSYDWNYSKLNCSFITSVQDVSPGSHTIRVKLTTAYSRVYIRGMALQTVIFYR